MERYSPSTFISNTSIWLFSAVIAIGFLSSPKDANAKDRSIVENSDDAYYEEPSLTAETNQHMDHVSEVADMEYATEDVAGTEHVGCQCNSHHSNTCHCNAHQSDASECCKKGKCAGVCLDPGHPAKPKHKKPGDIDEGDCPSIRYRMDDCLRSGDPDCVYKWAKPSITDKYSAWYVGGGAWFKGRGRTAEEGTWGLDYDGAFGHARTWLNYTCGKRQGGEGAYETDHVPLKKKF